MESPKSINPPTWFLAGSGLERPHAEYPSVVVANQVTPDCHNGSGFPIIGERNDLAAACLVSRRATAISGILGTRGAPGMIGSNDGLSQDAECHQVIIRAQNSDASFDNYIGISGRI